MTEGGVGTTGKLVGSQGERDYNQDAGPGISKIKALVVDSGSLQNNPYKVQYS